VAFARLLPAPGLWTSVFALALISYVAADYATSLTPLTVVVDGVPRQSRTQCATVGEVIEELGLGVHDADRLIPGPEVPVQPGMTVVLDHALSVDVVADGVTRAVRTHSRDADEIVREAGVELRSADRLHVDGLPWALGQASVPSSAGLLLGASMGASTGPRTASLFALSSRGRQALQAPLPIRRIEVHRAHIVHLDDDGTQHTLHTTAQTVGQALEEASVLLYLGDRIHPSLDTPTTTGLDVRIQRAVPVSVRVDGRTLRTRTHARTVGEVLAELGVSLVGQDYVEPGLNLPITRGLNAQVVRVTERSFVEQEEIPFETEWIADASLELDQRRLDDRGAIGITRRRYKAVYHDGQELKRTLEDQWIAQEPVPRRISYGTRIVVRTLDTPEGSVEYWRRIRVFLTSYTAATCGKTPDNPQYGVTRLGWKMRHGIIAVDPRVIRLRSQLYVPGYGHGVAGDTGGMIKGRHIDLGHEEDSFTMYYWWGDVYVLTPVPSPSQVRWILPDFPRER
jgi:uncharacterized protein YabE (DUF348 family)